MIEVKYSICDEVFFLNTSACRIEKAKVKGVQIKPTGISKTEEGEDRLDGFVVLYQTFQGPVLTESECFGSEEECRAFYREYFK